MRSICTLILFVTLSLTSVSAYNTPAIHNEDCRLIHASEHGGNTLEARIANDLVSGYWTSQPTTSSKNILWFDANGQLNQIDYVKGQTLQFENKTWSIHTESGIAFLVIDNQRYEVAQTCKGLELIHPVGYKSMQLDFNKKEASAQMTNLAGEWSAVGLSKGAFVDLTFDLDGQVNKSTGTKGEMTSVDGHYQLSADGDFLVLTFGEEVLVAKINYLAYGEMVLEQTMTDGEVASLTLMK